MCVVNKKFELLEFVFDEISLTSTVECCVVGVGPTPPPKNSGGVQQPCLRRSADGIPNLTGFRAR